VPSSSQADAPGHTEQPSADAGGVGRAPRIPSQYEEDGLEGILGQVSVANGAAAHAKDHTAVPLHHLLERRLISAVGVP
jgi:hypothetical protein